MKTRLKNLRLLLSGSPLDGIFISSLPNIYYLTDFPDFSTVDRDGFVLITQKNQYLFTHGIYKEAVEKNVPDFELIEILRENPISNAVKQIITKEHINKLGFEAFDMKVNEYKRMIAVIDKEILVETDMVNQLRIKKTTEEITKIKKSCQLGDKAFNFILKKMTPQSTEITLALELELFIKRSGAELSFPAIVAFGPHASKPHHIATNTKLEKNQFVLFDFGVKYENYNSDMTRTVFFGKANQKQIQAYNAVLESQAMAVTKIEHFLNNPLAKIKNKDIDNVSREYLVSLGYPQMPHSLGHGIGLEVHESPRLTPLSEEILANGNVFSIEPGIYIPDEYGIRIEDLYAIENSELKQLTNAPKNFIVV